MTVTPEQRQFAKAITQVVVRSSVAYSTTALVKGNVSTNSTFTKAQVYVGAFILGQMAAEKAVDYAETKLDGLINAFEKRVNEA